MHKEDVQTIGIHTFFKAQATEFILALQEKIQYCLSVGDKEAAKGYMDEMKRKSGYSRTYKNKVVDLGRTIMGKVLAGDVGYTGTGAITTIALGNGTATVQNSDTALDNQTFSKSIASTISNSPIVQIDSFFNTGEANQQHYEAGEFIDGTDLFARWLINELKTNTETLTVQSLYNITQ